MRFLRPLLLCSALFAAGCASLSGGSRQADIDELKARVIELQKKAAMAEVEIARLRQEVLAARGATPPRATPPPAPPMPPPRMEEPPAPAPQPVIEEDDLEEPAEAPLAPAPPAGGDAPSSPTPLSAEAQAVYDQAYTLYHQGRYLDAETAFQRFLQSHGASELADNASYWIGESRYGRGDLRGALQAFRETIERYPRGNKIPDALLKAAQCYEGLGETENARAAYDELVARFGDSAAAGVARTRRQQLR